MGRLRLMDGLVDLTRAEVVRGSGVRRLTGIECELLGYLGARAGRDVGRDELHERVWGHSAKTVSRAADYAVHRLRRKIEASPEDPRHLLTVTGGYRWVPMVSDVVAPRDRVVLLVAEPPEMGDAAWLAGCAKVVQECGGYLVDLAPDRLVVASAAPSVAAAVSRGLVALAPVRIGLAIGAAELLVDPVSGRTLYGGAALGRALSLARTARPGVAPDTPSDVGDADSDPIPSLPPRADRFIGRTTELHELLATAGGTWVLVGAAGSGKSRLAEELVARLGLPGWRVALDEIGSVEALLAAVDRAIGAVGTGPATPERIGAALSRRGRAVLVLDGAERVADGLGPILDRWRSEAPDIRLVVTSRERLPERDAFEIRGLPVADGVALFCDRCPRLPSTGWSTLVKAVDGLPLALELLAPRLRVIDPADLPSQLERLLEALVVPRSDGRPTMYGALHASWERLSILERQTLARATAFADSFDLSGAEAVLSLDTPNAPWFVDLLAALHDRHLIEVDGQRYRLLATVRAFVEARGGEDLSLLGNAAWKHAEWFTSLGRSIPKYVGMPPFGTEVLPDVQRAFGTAVHGRAFPMAAELGRIFAEVVTRVGGGASFSETIALVDEALALPNDDEARFWLEDERGSLLLRSGRSRECLASAERGRMLASELGAPVQVWAERSYAMALRTNGQLSAANAALDRTETLLEGVSDDRLRGLMLLDRGSQLVAAGRLHEALTVWRAAEAGGLDGALRDHIVGWLGVAELELGDLDAAMEHLGRAADGHRRSGARFSAAVFRARLGTAETLRGDREAGMARIRAALPALRDAESRAMVEAHLNLALFALWAGDLDTVSCELESSRAAAEVRGPLNRAMWLAVRSEERAARGLLAEAEQAGRPAALPSSLSVFAAQELLVRSSVHRGMVAFYGGDTSAATGALAVAMQGTQQIGVLPSSLLAQEVRRLRRALSRGGHEDPVGG